MTGERLKDIRKSQKKTQKEIAEKLGITQQAIALWEKGKTSPNPTDLSRLADVLGVSIDYLVGRPSLREEKTIYGLRPIPSLSDQELAEIADLVDSDPAFAEIREAFQNGSKNIKEFFALGVKMYQMEQKSKNDKL